MSTTANGIETTLRTLLRSPAPRATELLIKALGSASASLRVGAARALAIRPDRVGHRALVKRFHDAPADVRAALTDIVGPTPPLYDALAAFVQPDKPRLALRAAEVAVECGAVSALPALVEGCRWPEDAHSAAFAETVVALAETLEERLRTHDPAVRSDGATPVADPAFARRAAINALGSAITSDANLPLDRLVEAFLLLTPPDEPVLVRLLRTPGSAAHEALLRSLATSRSEGAFRVLAASLSDLRAPQKLVELACARRDTESISGICRHLGSRLGARARENVSRVESVGWLGDDAHEGLVDLPPDAQAVAIAIAAASRASRRALAEAVVLLIERGSPAGRLAACRAIESMPSHRALQPLLAAIGSDDAAVVAHGAKLLRKKNFPQATGSLVGLLDHADDAVRGAAQRSLRELSLATFRENADQLSDYDRRRAGRLVAKADPLALSSLRADLTAGAPTRRLRAMDMIDTMGVAAEMTTNLLASLGDPDGGVRAEAARLLAEVDSTPDVVDALVEAQSDSSIEVRAAAEAALIAHDCRVGLWPSEEPAVEGLP